MKCRKAKGVLPSSSLLMSRLPTGDERQPRGVLHHFSPHERLPAEELRNDDPLEALAPVVERESYRSLGSSMFAEMRSRVGAKRVRERGRVEDCRDRKRRASPSPNSLLETTFICG